MGRIMKKLLRECASQSGLDVYGLGARRDKWERAIEQFTDLIVQECLKTIAKTDTTQAYTSYDLGLVKSTMIKVQNNVKKHFEAEE